MQHIYDVNPVSIGSEGLSSNIKLSILPALTAIDDPLDSHQFSQLNVAFEQGSQIYKHLRKYFVLYQKVASKIIRHKQLFV